MDLLTSLRGPQLALAMRMVSKGSRASSKQLASWLVLAAAGASKGAMAGAAVGAAIGAASAIANSMLFSPPPPVGYVKDGRPVAMNISDDAKQSGVEGFLRSLQTYRDAHPRAYDRAAQLTQRIMNLRERFKAARMGGGDGVHDLALMTRTAIRADALWRELVDAVKCAGDLTGLEQVSAAAMQLHIWSEQCIAISRDEFQMSEQIQLHA